MENFKIIYEKAIEEKHNLEKDCEDFCRKNARAFKTRGPWLPFDIPAKLGPLIYPSEGTLQPKESKEEEQEEISLLHSKNTNIPEIVVEQ